MAEISSITLEMLRAVRREQDVQRRDVHALTTAMADLSAQVRRGFETLDLRLQVIDRRQGEAATDLASMVRMEMLGISAHLETSVERRLLDRLDEALSARSNDASAT